MKVCIHVASFETPRIVDERTCISRISGVFIKAKAKEYLRRTAILLLYILYQMASFIALLPWARFSAYVQVDP